MRHVDITLENFYKSDPILPVKFSTRSPQNLLPLKISILTRQPELPTLEPLVDKGREFVSLQIVKHESHGWPWNYKMKPLDLVYVLLATLEK